MKISEWNKALSSRIGAEIEQLVWTIQEVGREIQKWQRLSERKEKNFRKKQKLNKSNTTLNRKHHQ